MSASWTPERTSLLVTLCHGEVIRGTGDGNGFKAQVWSRILIDFNREANVAYTQPQLSSKLSDLKNRYKTFTHCANNSGFGWDIVKKIPTAPEDTWVAYLLAHPKAKEYRFQTLENYDELNDIFCGKIATGKYASSSTSLLIEPTYHTPEITLDTIAAGTNGLQRISPPSAAPSANVTNSSLKPVVQNLSNNTNYIPRKRKNKHDGVIEVNTYDIMYFLHFLV